MKKFLMSVLSAVLVLTMLPLNGLLGFSKASAASNDLILSLNVVEETDSEVSLAIRLENGKFNALDLVIEKKTDKIGTCTFASESDDLLMFMMKDIKKQGGTGSSAINAGNGCFSIAMTVAYDKVGTNILEYTFEKNSPDKVTCEDFSVEITSCAADKLRLNPSVVSNLPEPTEVHTHNYSKTVTAPTCTAQGYTTYTCSCGDSYVSDYVPATGHSFGAWTVTKAATETATGIKERKCSKCSAVETEIIPKLQHTHSYSLTKTVNATCTKNGTKTYACSCGDSYTETILATGHSFGEWTVTKAATTTAEGLKERKCSKCGAVETEVIPKLAAAVICRASLDNQGADSAGTIILWYKYNTVENGVYYYYDSACARPFAGTKIVCPTKSGYTFGGYFTGKNGTGTQYVSADGSVKDVYKTSDSKTLYAYWIVNHVHSYTSKITKAATCTEAGVKTFTCTCGDSYTETIPATGHSFGAWTVTKAATTTAEGLKERKCSKCGAVETEVIPKLAAVICRASLDNQGADSAGTIILWYKYNTVENGIYYYYDSACARPFAGTKIVCPTKSGYTFGGYFTGKNGTGTQYVSADGSVKDVYKTSDSKTLYAYWIVNHVHSYTSKITKAATCTEAGVKTFTCTCGDSYTETIPAIGHRYTSKVTAPTCTAQGYTTYTCSCGDSYVSDYVPATGHSFGEWTVTKAATTTAEGLKERRCSKCGAVETEVIPKLEPQQESKVMLNNHDISLRYKASSKLTASSENVEWSSSNTKVAVVDRNGNVKATGIGTAIITVTDTETNTTDECKFTVSYDWWQWIIVIVLFGWIWY